MPESLVIINTSPLLYLHQTANLHLLQKLYGTIAVPLAVQQELQVGMQQGADVPAIEQIKWIQIRPVASASLVPAVIDLGQGEAEVIALGLETTDSLLILDDQLARRIAALYELKYTGTLGVLVKAKQAGYVSSVAATIKMLQAKGMWLSDPIIREVLRLSDELVE